MNMKGETVDMLLADWCDNIPMNWFSSATRVDEQHHHMTIAMRFAMRGVIPPK